MALPADKLLRNTPRAVQQRAVPCIPTRVGKVAQITDKRRGILTRAVYRVKGIEDTYRVVIDLMPKAKGKVVEIVPQAPCWVTCTCAFFLYRCEYALTKVGSSSIIYTNGKPAHQMNPRNTPYVCKHVFRALKKLLATKGK